MNAYPLKRATFTRNQDESKGLLLLLLFLIKRREIRRRRRRRDQRQKNLCKKKNEGCVKFFDLIFLFSLFLPFPLLLKLHPARNKRCGSWTLSLSLTFAVKNLRDKFIVHIVFGS